MSVRKYKISPLNPYRIVRVLSEQNPRYNTKQFDWAWFSELNAVNEWEQQIGYEQLVQNNDRFSLQIWANSDAYTMNMYLYKCDGTLINTTTIPANLSITIDIQEDGNNYYVYNYVNNSFWDSIPEGKYYFYFDMNLATSHDFFISEPIAVKQKHEGSVLVEYSNSYNRDYIIFEQTRQKFEIRLIGSVQNMQALINRVSFIDNAENVTALKSTAFRGWTFWAGGNSKGIADYLLDKLNYIFALNGTKIDGKSYVAADGASWVKSENINYPLYIGSIELREKEIKAAYSTIEGDLALLSYSGEFPFVAMKVNIGISNVYDFVYQNPTLIVDASALSTFIDTLNNEATIQGLDGVFYADANTVFYTLGIGEVYDQSDSSTLNRFMSFSNVSGASGVDLNFDLALASRITGVGNSLFAFAFLNTNTILASGNVSTGVTFNYTHSYTVPTSGSYTYYLFHDETMEYVSISGDYLSAVGANCPQNLKAFRLFDSPRITSFSIITSLRRSSTSLQKVLIYNNTLLASILGYWNNIGGTAVGFSALTFLDLHLNHMAATNIDAIYNNVYSTYAIAGLPFPSNGYMNTTNQNTAALPTTTSLTARNSLSLTKHWTIIT